MCADLIRASRSTPNKAKLQKALEDRVSSGAVVPYMAGPRNRHVNLLNETFV